MTLAQYYKNAEPVLGVAKILYAKLFDLYKPYKISDIAKTTSGGTPNRGNDLYYNGDIPWIKSGELNDSTIKSSEEFITEEGLSNSSAKLFPKGTLLVAMYGATAGKTGILDFDATTNQAVCALFPDGKIRRDYLYWFLRQHRIDFIIQSKGGAQPNISQKVIKETLIPVPSLDIQKKVTDFLNDVQDKNFINSECEVLDTDAFLKINHFFDIRNVHEILNNKLDIQKNLVSQLKQSILQDAIQGKLTKEWREENPDIEPASKLLERIKEEKENLVKEKKIKKQKSLPAIEEGETPFELPDGWAWCRLGDVGITQTGTTPAKNEASNYGAFIPFIQPSNITAEGLNFDCLYLSEQGMMSSRFIQKHSNLMVCIGGSAGKTCYSEVDITCNQQINTITSYQGVSYKYLDVILKSKYFQEAVWSKIKQGSTPILNKGRWSNILIPICSELEQKK